MSESIARGFAGQNCCLFKLTIMPSVRVLPIFLLSPYRRGNTFFLSEEEILLGCGRLDLQSITFDNGSTSLKTIHGHYHYLPHCLENPNYMPEQPAYTIADTAIDTEDRYDFMKNDNEASMEQAKPQDAGCKLM
jgi:hypothetical protein